MGRGAHPLNPPMVQAHYYAKGYFGNFSSIFTKYGLVTAKVEFYFEYLQCKIVNDKQ